MRLLLVNPQYPLSETPSPPLGLAYLAAALEDAGVEVKVLDFVVFPYSKKGLEAELTNFKPNIVGVTSVTMNFDDAIEVVKDVKGIDPEILTIMGGAHVSFCAKETMEAFPELDFIALGEGEETIVELAMEAENGGNWRKVRGVVYREGPGLRSGGDREPLIDLDSLPLPARHLIPLGRYRALGLPLSLTTSRGCPFRCIFCVGRKMLGSEVRYRRPEKVVDELEYLARLNFHQVNIADDLFTANKRHCLNVCNEIIRRRLRVAWAAFSRVDTVSSEVLKKMKEAGCSTISFGVESANPGILKTIKKGITTGQVIHAVMQCTEVGISPHLSFLLGLPGETPETLNETTEFARGLKEIGASYGFHLLAPFPGTEIREESEGLGIRITTNDWSQYHANRAIVETPSVSRKMLDRVVMKWEARFDEWLGEIKRRMERGEAAEEEAWQVTRLEHTVLIHDLMMNNVIEERGASVSKNGHASEGEVLESLVERLVKSTAYTVRELSNTLKFAVEQDFLRWTECDGYVKWQWVDYL